MKTADPELMRAINRFHVMDAIRCAGAIARVEICARTELSPATVSAITATLLDDGLIVPRHLGDVRDAEREFARGRPRVMLELNPLAAFVVGVKLAPEQITVTTTDFRADTLATVSLPIRISRQPVTVIVDLVEDGIRRCLADAGLAVRGIAGVCVGLPGRIERSAGICRSSPIFGEPDVPFADLLRARLGVPVVIESDVNLVTMAESWFGAARDLDDFLVVSVEHGLGLGVMANGELYRGANGIGPDLDAMLVGTADGTSARLGTVASETAILAQGRALLDGREHAAAFGTGRGMATVIARAQAGDPGLVAMLRGVGEALGAAVANLIILFAPARVVLAGEAMNAGAVLLDPLRATVAGLLPPEVARLTDIVVYPWSDDSWARGAAALTLRELYGAPWSTTGPAGPR